MAQQSYDVGDDPGDGRYDCEAAGTADRTMLISIAATVVVFVFPVIAVRFLMMAGNWGQHAFIDQADPANCYTNSITCINATYNERCFNDGYHIGHHVKQNRHWTEMPEDFQRNIKRYAAEKAIVFQKIDFFVVWLLLMFKKYDTLAGLMVQLGETERTSKA